MLQSSIDITLKISAWKEAIMVLVEHVLIIPRDSAVKFIPSVMVQNIRVTCMLRLVKNLLRLSERMGNGMLKVWDKIGCRMVWLGKHSGDREQHNVL